MLRLLSALILCGLSLASDVMNYTSWQNVLQRHLKRGTLPGQGGIVTSLVDYDGVKNDVDFADFIKQLGTLSMPATMTENEFYALYMNAYNAFIFKMITDFGCRPNGTAITSIKEIPNVFDLKVLLFAGQHVSLNEVEGMLRNPSLVRSEWSEIQLVHACIVCAGMSCPSLLNFAFNNSIAPVTVQMAAQMTEFLSNEKKGSILNKQTTSITMSKIFSWFPYDFQPTVLGYLLPYFPVDEYQFIEQNMQQLNDTATYFDYDWQLNSQTGMAPCGN
eukprot:TRINITY_DN1310_c2_g1_i1.p1 TRINITY_DN1310_c2_g1~~TRINITY_DN1310_c2_g1_i1.p1  ORF type:complete len:301 (+),score=45.21 TRINITY_DN1310_c2_g1_i1:79-903(+)